MITARQNKGYWLKFFKVETKEFHSYAKLTNLERKSEQKGLNIYIHTCCYFK